MLRFSYILCCLLCVSLARNIASADEPKKAEAEKIPAPKVKVKPTYSVVPYVPRGDTREVWQHYGVNAMGRFVPRVIVTPHGAYYSRDLQPYPWVSNRPTAVLRTVVD